ncbi:hypothetical protein SPRG_13805 [Saprolegnia parasitica CBS 223.65]|uniref:PX domain-containing protein n=1 Tax=Saprolegnia parasitica (strain CBS 223.65) TaxID=695850 RepID=A0A067C3G9_SAPPC|nr:hypothetical protein SPRG_13805 [Saprolegnia parasitica CBS 223.65]KDO21096.1 hypothetical protein SPRG_13805 [Saprolegnia parasitica CBS 223.65]|eukprot:XP_012208191.1 hypothetical protein SPRG_13805 [Saprolegnia parasitica CBS 223.65]
MRTPPTTKDSDEPEDEFDLDASLSPRLVDLTVTSYSVGTDGIVMYHVDVKNPHDILDTYTIRRRYTDFRNLYFELSTMMPLEDKEAALASRSSLLSRFTISNSTLPPLPSAGVWSYLRKHDTKVLEKRRAAFQDILDAAASHTEARVSSAFQTFLSVAPESLNRRASYTSLRDYSVPADNNKAYTKRKKNPRKRGNSGQY